MARIALAGRAEYCSSALRPPGDPGALPSWSQVDRWRVNPIWSRREPQVAPREVKDVVYRW